MYEDSGYFDPSHDSNSIPPPLIYSPSQVPDYNSITNNGLEDNLQIDLDDGTASIILNHIHLHDNNNHIGFDLMQEDISVAPQMDAVNWDSTNQQYDTSEAGMYPNQPYGPAPDLLNLLQLPRCNVGPMYPPTSAAASISLDGSRGANIWADEGPVFYDPSALMGYVGAQPNVLRDLYQSLPQNYGLFCGMEEREGAMGGVFQEIVDGRQFDGGVMDYRRGDVKGEVKGNFATERQRREQLNEKYKALRSLVPNPTKICEGSSVYAGAIAKKLLEVMDRQYPTLTFPASY